MTWLTKADTWLIERVYQWLVDVTGKPREWWVEQCSFVLLITGVISAWFRNTDADWRRYVLILAVTLVAGFMFIAARCQQVPMLGGAPWRKMFLSFGVIATALTWAHQTAGVAWLETAYQVALISAYYFAACQPPRPREPRRKPVTAEAV